MLRDRNQSTIHSLGLVCSRCGYLNVYICGRIIYIMGKLALCLLTILLLATACFKKYQGCSFTNNDIAAPASEQANLENYLSSNGITSAVKHSSGFYYQVISQGGGPVPGLCSFINVGYIGKLTNGNI